MTPRRRSIEQVCDDLALVVVGIVAVIAGLTFQDYGLGWDDYTHAEYADLLLSMYGSGFKDTSALSFANLYMYGGGFDMVAALLHKILPLDLFETRRLLGALVGVVGLAVTWRVGRRMGGPIAGLAALMLLSLCPTYYGHMFMNPKDSPFAVAMIILILGLVRLSQEYPRPSPHTVLIVGLGTGLAVALAETGPRPEDPVIADTVFTVVREALTNVMRHAAGATRIVLALDHDDSATRITVSDDGANTQDVGAQRRPVPPPGNGLTHLADMLGERGGVLSAGPIHG